MGIATPCYTSSFKSKLSRHDTDPHPSHAPDDTCLDTDRPAVYHALQTATRPNLNSVSSSRPPTGAKIERPVIAGNTAVFEHTPDRRELYHQRTPRPLVEAHVHDSMLPSRPNAAPSRWSTIVERNSRKTTATQLQDANSYRRESSRTPEVIPNL